MPRITTRLKGWGGEAKSAVSNRQRETFEQTCIAFETFIGSTKFGYRI